MITGYRWARRIGFTRWSALRLTATSMRLSLHDPPKDIYGRVVQPQPFPGTRVRR